MRKIIYILFGLFISIPTIIRAEHKIIDSKWDPYFKSISTSDVTALPNILIGEEIYFQKNSNSSSADELDQFLNITPDTIWIKRKKKPKLDKDYRLMPYYHGIEEEKYYGIKKYTPYYEIENAVFRVDSVSSVMTSNSNSYYRSKYCYVYLFNTKSSERLIWVHTESNNNPLTVYSKTLGTKMVKDEPSFYYGKYSLYYSKMKSSEYTKTSIISGIYYVSLTNGYTYYPHIDITLSNNKTITHPSTYSNTDYNIISESEYQALIDKENKEKEAELEAKKVYTIDSKYYSDSTYKSLPFSFRYIFGITKGGYVNQTIDKYTSSYSGKYLSSGNIILIADKQKMHGKNYYIGLYANKCFYIPENDITIPEEEQPKLDTLLACDTTTRKVYFNWSKDFQDYRNNNKNKELIAEFDSHAKYGLSIISWGAYDESEYTDGTGMRFEFYNPTKKMIKYITINFVGYNAVDDPVSGYEGRTITRKCIGPIDPGETGEYVFEYVWFTDIVEYAKVKSILVQYKDGSTKRITNVSKITWSEELYQLLNNPVLDGFECIENLTSE